MSSVDEILKRFQKAKARKQNWDTLYEEAFEYAAPEREIFDEFREGEEKQNTELVYDSTGQHALSAFVSNLQSSLVPPMKKWIQLRAGNQIPPEGLDEANQMLDDVTETMFDFIKISNFDTEISTSFHDLAAGTGAILVNKGTNENPLVFSSVHIKELFFEKGPQGKPGASFREMKVNARNIEATWDDAVIPAELQKDIEDNPDMQFCVVEATIPTKMNKFNSKEDREEAIEGFRYVVIDQKSKMKIVDREQQSNPWIIYRWSTLPGETYGRGPLLNALPDIKSLNKVKELILKNGSLHVAGVYTILDDSAIGLDNILIGPGVFIPVESNGGPRGPSIASLPRSGDLQTSQFIFNDLQQSINKTLFAEPLGRVDLPVKTATEVSLRQAELARRIGSAFGKLQFELMIPLVKRILFILNDMGLIELGDFTVDGQIINIEYVSPLAQAQNEEELRNDIRYVETIVGLFGPQIGYSLVNIQNFAKSVAKKTNATLDIVPTDEQFEQIKQSLQAGIQQLSQAQQQPEEVPEEVAA